MVSEKIKSVVICFGHRNTHTHTHTHKIDPILFNDFTPSCVYENGHLLLIVVAKSVRVCDIRRKSASVRDRRSERVEAMTKDRERAIEKRDNERK